jgi:hypothetical protein
MVFWISLEVGLFVVVSYFDLAFVVLVLLSFESCPMRYNVLLDII